MFGRVSHRFSDLFSRFSNRFACRFKSFSGAVSFCRHAALTTWLVQNRLSRQRVHPSFAESFGWQNLGNTLSGKAMCLFRPACQCPSSLTCWVCYWQHGEVPAKSGWRKRGVGFKGGSLHGGFGGFGGSGEHLALLLLVLQNTAQWGNRGGFDGFGGFGGCGGFGRDGYPP